MQISVYSVARELVGGTARLGSGLLISKQIYSDCNIDDVQISVKRAAGDLTDGTARLRPHLINSKQIKI